MYETHNEFSEQDDQRRNILYRPLTLLVVLFAKVFAVLKPFAVRISGLIDKNQERVFDLSYIITIVLCFCFVSFLEW
jgi:hypothetical protein